MLLEILSSILLIVDSNNNSKVHINNKYKTIFNLIDTAINNDNPDGCAECFPFEMIEELETAEYR